MRHRTLERHQEVLFDPQAAWSTRTWFPVLSPPVLRSLVVGSGTVPSGGAGRGPAGVDELVPGPVPGQSQASSAAGADDASRDGDDPEPEPFGLSATGRPDLVEGQSLHPHEKVDNEGDDLEPEVVLGVVVKGRFRRPGVRQAPNVVLAAGALPVADVESGQTNGGSACLPPTRRARPAPGGRSTAAGRRVGAFVAGDDTHPGRPVLRTRT